MSKMRISVLLCLLVACCGMAIVGQVDEVSSDYYECCAGNFGEFLYFFDLYNLTFEDILCVAIIVGDDIYEFGRQCFLFYLRFVQFLQASLIWSIISTLYYSSVGLLVCDLFYTTLIKPRFFPETEESLEEWQDSDDETGGNSSADMTESTISVRLLFTDSCSSLDSSDITSDFDAVWESRHCEQSFVLKRRCCSLPSFNNIEFPGLVGLVRRCKSMTALNVVRRVSNGSSLVIDALNISFSAHSRTVFSRLSSSSGSLNSFLSMCSLSEENLTSTRSDILGRRSSQLLSGSGRKGLLRLSKSDTILLKQSENRIKSALARSQSEVLHCLPSKLLSSKERKALPRLSKSETSLVKSHSGIKPALTRSLSDMLLCSLPSQLLRPSKLAKALPSLSKSDTNLVAKSDSKVTPLQKAKPSSAVLRCSPSSPLMSSTGSKGQLCGMSSSDDNSIALSSSSRSELLSVVSIQSRSSQSHHSFWTFYTSPVPGSITSSHAQNVQLRRHEREYLFVRRPYLVPSAVVSSWLSQYFAFKTGRAPEECDDLASQGEPSGQGVQRDPDAEEGSVSQDGSDGQRSLGEQPSVDAGSADLDGSSGEEDVASQSSTDDDGELVVSGEGQSDHYNLVMPTCYGARGMLRNQFGEGISRFSYHSNGSADQQEGESVSHHYLINDLKTEVVLSDIPPPVLGMFPARACSFAVGLHRRSQWSERKISASLPNINKIFGLNNIETVFNLQSLDINVDDGENTAQDGIDSPERRGGYDNSDEREFICDDALDSISVVCEKIERRDQALRDAARARIEENRAREARRLRILREEEEIEARSFRQVQVPPPCFVDVLQRQAYKDVFVPLLLEAGKEVLFSFLLNH